MAPMKKNMKNIENLSLAIFWRPWISIILVEVILLGDILDSWRHDYLNVIINERYFVDKLKEIKNNYPGTNFHNIAGNHDYHLLWLQENGADYPFEIKKSIEIKSKNEVFFYSWMLT
jgi:hypothetical protein